MDRIFIDLGFVSISWYAFLIVSGMLICLLIALKELKKHDIDLEIFYDYIFYMLLFGIIGARLWYVIFDLELYVNNPLSIFAIWNGGLAIHGGITAGVLVSLYFYKKKQIQILMYLDVLVPGFLIGQSIGRWGNFVNQEAHGPATTQDFLANTLHLPSFIVSGMLIDGTYYQPTFLYESIWNFIGFLLVILLLRRIFRYKYGFLTGFYFMWYGMFRFWLEDLRTDALTLGSIEVAKLASAIMFIFGIILIIYVLKKEKKDENRS